MSNFVNRRDFLSLCGGAAALTALPHAAYAGKVKELTLYGPPAGPSLILAHAAKAGFLKDVVDTSSFKAWRNPDEMRAGLSSGTMQAVVLPVQAAAALYNKGFPLKLVNVMTKGLLYVVSPHTDIKSVGDLKGKAIAVPFKGDTPDIIFNRLIEHAQLDVNADITVHSVGSPIEAIQMMLSGRADAALTPEPANTAAILKAKSMGKTVTRVIDIQKEWGALVGTAPVIPQAGLAVTNAFDTANPGLVDAIQAALVAAAVEVNANPQVAAENATEALGTPAPVLAASVPSSYLGAWKAAELRESIETMLQAMADFDPKKIGGKLPDENFYY